MNKPLGLTEALAQQVEKGLRTKLAQKTAFHIYVFGSRSAGGFRQYSDLDLWIESTPSLTLAEVAEISLMFDESDLPIKVDIVTPETCFEEYKNSILKNRKLWISSLS